MRRKKKSVCIALLLLFTIASLVGGYYLYNRKLQYNDIKTNKLEDNKNQIKENFTDENKEIKQKVETKEESTKEEKDNSKSSLKSNIKNKKSSNIDSSVNEKTTSSDNSSVDVNSSNNTKQEVEEKQEESKTQTDNQKHYIDIPDPDSYLYSFHHGHIDFLSLDECEKNSEKYLMMDVNDIYGSWCMEVQDENGKVLGAYLYLKCNSGNCDRYKGY